MKLNRTREEWAKISIDGRSYYHREKMAVEDIATLHAEVERLREAATRTLPVMARAFSRLHSLPRVSDSELAADVVKAKEAIRQALGDTHD